MPADSLRRLTAVGRSPVPDEPGRTDVRRPTGHRGTYVVIAGPDGAGKSTVVDALIGDPLGASVLRLHHRPHVLGGMTAQDGAPVPEPHGQPPYPLLISLAKLLYLYLDYQLGWFVRIAPWLRGGGDVVLERGWWDLLVDPRRYRLRPMPRLVQLLGRWLPRPDVTLILGGDAHTIAMRKGELSVEETERQLAAWRGTRASMLRARPIDVTTRIESTQGQARRAVRSVARGRWIGLPTRQDPRWILPTSPPSVAAGSFVMYNPVTPRGRVAWQVSHRLAGLGVFRLLLTHRVVPPTDVLEKVASHVPPGGRVAVARGNHPGRCTALIMDGSSGRPVAFAKIAIDHAGRQALLAEADAVERFRPLLPPGLSSPPLLASEPDLLLFGPVELVPRSRAWLMPPEVARLLGRFYLNGARAGVGPAHGDCAPWNLLGTPAGWSLVDWADARDDAPPFEDLFHHLVQANSLLGRPGTGALTAGIKGRGPIAKLITDYAREADVDPLQAPPLFVDYLRRSGLHLDRQRADGRAGVSARRRLRHSIVDREAV